MFRSDADHNEHESANHWYCVLSLDSLRSSPALPTAQQFIPLGSGGLELLALLSCHCRRGKVPDSARLNFHWKAHEISCLGSVLLLKSPLTLQAFLASSLWLHRRERLSSVFLFHAPDWLGGGDSIDGAELFIIESELCQSREGRRYWGSGCRICLSVCLCAFPVV